MAQEQLQERVLGAAELQAAVAAPDVARGGLEAQVAEAQLVGGAVDAAQQRAQARLQLAQREGLDEVVVGARLQPGDAVVDPLAR